MYANIILCSKIIFAYILYIHIYKAPMLVTSVSLTVCNDISYDVL